MRLLVCTHAVVRGRRRRGGGAAVCPGERTAPEPTAAQRTLPEIPPSDSDCGSDGLVASGVSGARWNRQPTAYLRLGRVVGPRPLRQGWRL